MAEAEVYVGSGAQEGLAMLAEVECRRLFYVEKLAESLA